jgi:hypothetical protein
MIERICVNFFEPFYVYMYRVILCIKYVSQK